jgi:hypothetical protein
MLESVALDLKKSHWNFSFDLNLFNDHIKIQNDTFVQQKLEFKPSLLI